MYIEAVEMENIRSYRHQRIELGPGISVFRGDIGAGKSSILQAIEFAIFGTDAIRYEDILREGCSQGRVLLRLSHRGKRYEIERVIKKRPSGTNQRVWITDITKDGQTRTEYTPTEAKARIMTMLEFRTHEDTGAKKSQGYRYALYVPQEEMKAILENLQTNREERVNLLRRMFGIEKYKLAKDNAGAIKKEIARELTAIKKETEGIDGKKCEIEKLKKDLEAMEANIQELETALSDKKEVKNRINVEITGLEAELKALNDAKNALEHINSELKSRKEDYERKMAEMVECERAVEEFKALEPRANRYKEIEGQMEKMEVLRDKFLKLRTEIEALKHTHMTQKAELMAGRERLKEKGEIQAKASALREDTSEMEKIEGEIQAIEGKIGQFKGEIKAAEEKIKELNNEVDSLKTLKGEKVCPKCRQPIDDSHIKKIISDTEEKIRSLKDEIKEKQDSFSTLNEKKKELSDKKRLLREKVNELQRMEGRLKELERLEREIDKKQNEINNIENDLKKLEEEITALPYNEDNYKKLKKEMNDLKVVHERYISLKEKTNRIGAIKDEMRAIEVKINTLQERSKEMENELKRGNITEKEKQKERLVGEREDIEREIRSLIEQIGKLKGGIKEKKKILDTLKQDLEALLSLREKGEKLEYALLWIEDKFLKALDLIEKNVMYSIRTEFNEMFQRFFNMILQDSEFTLEIDEEFFPRVMVEGGYERNIKALSGGERTSISLAYRLALNSVLKDLYLGSDNNILILDEPTDGFSKEQIERMKDILRELECRQIIIVSHEEEVEGVANTIYRVDKRSSGSVVTPASQYPT